MPRVHRVSQRLQWPARLLGALVLMIMAVTWAQAAPEIDHERLGPLHLGMAQAEVQRALGTPTKRSAAQLEAATGQYVETWSWPRRGVELTMASQTKGGARSLARLQVTAPCAYRTQRGVGIGSTEAAVRKAYAGLIDKDAAADATHIVVGSVYGGIIFDLANGHVKRIFIGAAAE